MKKMELDLLFNNIIKDCVSIIKEKNIDMEDLSSALGVSNNKLLFAFNNRIDDFSFYFKAYDIINEW